MKIVVGFLLAFWGLAAAEAAADPLEIDPWTTRVHFENDFEDEVMSPWFDQSAARVIWQVERLDSPSEVDSPAPPPTAGTKYLRATRDANLNSGLAVLHSPVFTALPGDRVDFSFWIRSRQPQANNLELYYVENNTEVLLIGLSQFSSSSNFEWRNASVELPFTAATNIYLVFYGFCGTNREDAIGLDNIVVSSDSGTTKVSTTEATTVTTPPDCNAVFNTPSGTFTSPNYPDNYNNNLNCNWLIVTAPDTNIVLSFTDFYTQSNYDVLKAYDGASTSSAVLGSFSGSSVTRYVESTDNVMLVTFTTDSSVTYSGFLANYDSYAVTTTTTTRETTTTSATTTTPETTTVPNNCGDTLTDDSGELTSPNYPNVYPNDLDCQTAIRVSAGKQILVTFSDFYTELGRDFLIIHNGATTASPELMNHSGTNKPVSVLSSANEVLVRFTTDSTGNGYRGWSFTYVAV